MPAIAADGRYGMKEADALGFLQKAAMDGRLKMGEVARRIPQGDLEA
jgi:AmiR/NasT family two-component response regulator